ncbi:hypothetical protein AFL01nite_04900 [Aeromicrobium flavum]|uniref:Uncharacterized protein n=1 Tax=Aeromicrobium flavum TaxID=416568 RepID=A0A512HRT1_9ACTN|nr:hypothetical protein [Aeromicrobium flavum]GEO88163.1 hypothetical protein AFL01nite_04900 [Aeromicrobium flavum]
MTRAQYAIDLPSISRSQIQGFLGVIPEVVQTGFWIVVATVTILTYKHARSTLLQPLNTEVFKLQLESMSRVLGEFVGKDEIGLRHEFAFDELFTANIFLMLDNYAKTHLGLRRKPGSDTERPYEKCRTWLMDPADLEIANEYVRLDTESEPSEEILVKSWADYGHSAMPIPDVMVERKAALQAYLQDPLLPTSCVKLIDEFLEVVDRRVTSLGEVLSRLAPTLPELYPNRDALDRASFDGFRNEWNSVAPNLEPQAQAITDFARSYFRSDDFTVPGVAKSKRRRQAVRRSARG